MDAMDDGYRLSTTCRERRGKGASRSGIAATIISVLFVADATLGPGQLGLARSPETPTVLPSFADSTSVSGLLTPGGFSRPHWQSFEGVTPVVEVEVADPDRFVIAIDPGHGGSDPGARGPNGLLEKDLTLDIARRVRLFLSEIDDIDVLLTRERDHGLSRSARVAAVRRSEADLFVSLHFNHLPQSELTLVESYYAGPENIAESRAHQRRQDLASGQAIRTAANALSDAPNDISFTRGSQRFARLVQQRVFGEVSRGNPDAHDAGVKQNTLFVLTRSYTSGALIELTCLSNAEEASRLTDVAYRNELAASLADAIRDYRRLLDERPLDGTGA